MDENSLQLHQLVRALALQNAVNYQGKAEKKPVLAKIVSIRPDLRQRIKDILPLIDEAVKEVNALSPGDQLNMLRSFPEFIVRERPRTREKALTPLPEAKAGKVITRFSPNPDFVLHLGSARAAVLSHSYARMYDGKFILRFEDTDPRTKRPERRYYEFIRKDLRWLGCLWDEEYIQSQRLKKYYDVARELIGREAVYVCTCERDTFKRYLTREMPCPDRDLSADVHLQRLESMLSGGYKEGEAVIRVKTDLRYANPALRDWPLLRVIDTEIYPHPLTGSEYVVWPLYNFSCAVDDQYMGITHIIRGIEHEVNEVKQRHIFEYMGWRPPTAVHHGRLSIPKGVLSKSSMLRGIQEGTYSGYDDPRLATLTSLRRRGFQSETIRRVVHEVGIRPTPATIEWSNLEAYNRKVVDRYAHRRFVVLEHYILRVDGVEEPLSEEIRLHPDHEEMGFRKFSFIPEEDSIEVIVEKRDVEFFRESPLIRLMGLANIKLDEVRRDEAKAHLIDYEVSTALRAKAPIIHWVPLHDHTAVTLLWPDGSIRQGEGERGLLEEEKGNIIQMERLGYSRVEAVEESRVRLVFAHP